MVMAQGYAQEEVAGILEDVEGSTLIDEQTRALLRFADTVTRHAFRVTERDIQALRDFGLSDEAILEATSVIAAFNMFVRIADALGAPVEHLRAAMAERG
ncbi:MAG: carboxymuconolactone decarboxylase family protein [Nitrospinota bacterium]